MLKSAYNIAYTRRRYLKPLVSDAELRPLGELEKLCFPPPQNYDLRTLRMFLSMNGIGLVREQEIVGEELVLRGFHLFHCFLGELITLDVHPDYRRLGLGAAMLEESLGKLRLMGHATALCQIGVRNEGSLRLHRRFGFEAVRVLPHYYGPWRHAYEMMAPLTDRGRLMVAAARKRGSARASATLAGRGQAAGQRPPPRRG